MKNLKDIIFGGLIAVALFYFIGNFKGCKTKTADPTDRLKDKQEIINMVIEDRDYWRGKYDEVIGEVRFKDSLLLLKDKTTVKKYEKIPVIVNSYNRDELRAAISNY